MDNSWPHSPQNLSPGIVSEPHSGQTNIRFDPHSRQNFLVSGFSVLQSGHFITYAPNFNRNVNLKDK